MGMYRCHKCEEFVDNDFFPCVEMCGELVCPHCVDKKTSAEIDHKYDDGKNIHACEMGDGPSRYPDTRLVWTVCGKDVPANRSFKDISLELTCKDCLEHIA